MDTLNQREIERILAFMLPGSKVQCLARGDGTVSLTIEGPMKEMFAVTGLVLSDYQGLHGIHNLANLLVEELALSRNQEIRSGRA